MLIHTNLEGEVGIHQNQLEKVTSNRVVKKKKFKRIVMEKKMRVLISRSPYIHSIESLKHNLN